MDEISILLECDFGLADYGSALRAKAPLRRTIPRMIGHRTEGRIRIRIFLLRWGCGRRATGQGDGDGEQAENLLVWSFWSRGARTRYNLAESGVEAQEEHRRLITDISSVVIDAARNADRIPGPISTVTSSMV